MQHKFIFMLKHTFQTKIKTKIFALGLTSVLTKIFTFIYFFYGTQVYFHAFHTITLSVFYLSVWCVLCTIKYIRVDLMYSDPV